MPENFTGSSDLRIIYSNLTLLPHFLVDFLQPVTTGHIFFALRLRGNALNFYTALPTAQQIDFNLSADALRQNYTTNVDILKARLKEQPNQDVSAFLCDIGTLARRAYRAFPHLVEQIVLTSFIEGLSDATLRCKIRNSKPATADDVLALTMELNSFLENKKGAPSKSEMAETSVNAIFQGAPTPSKKEWMDELVRTLTEGFDSETVRNQPSRSDSIDSQGTRPIRFQNTSN